jgi:hypothetical protein
METRESALLDNFIVAFRDALGFELRNIKTDIPDDFKGIDAILKFKTPNDASPLEIAVELKTGSLYPRDVMMWAFNFSKFKTRDRVKDVFLVAEMLSSSAREALRQNNINYFDSTGTLYFKSYPRLIDIERRPKRLESSKPLTVFAGAREQVVHALLYHHLQRGPETYVSGVDLADHRKPLAIQ